MPDKPNILFIFTDQQNASMMGCSGNPHVQTPAMDSLARDGMRFSRAYCTNPVCVPSRFSLMTGRMPSAMGLRDNTAGEIPPIDPAIIQNGLGHLLREAGYRTVYGGKQHLPRMNAEMLGFEYIEKDERDGLAETCSAFLNEEHTRPWAMVASFVNPHDICYMAIRSFGKDERKGRQLDSGQTELRTLDEALTDPIRDDDPPLPENAQIQEDEPAGVRAILEQKKFKQHARTAWGEKEWLDHRRAYARLTEIVDAQIGRVLAALEASGQADNTVVIFSSDHGDMDGSHRMEHKTAFYEECCRIPFVVRWPGQVESGTVNETLISNGLDLVPTLCGIAERPVPADLPGRSLLPLLKGEASEIGREYVPIESEFGYAVWTEDYGYARYDLPGNSEQLYDLKGDAGQMRNAVNDPSKWDVLVEMRGIFDREYRINQTD
ncbi:sulfatase [Planctomycetota bacterium]